jgi:hypothetical protein
MAQVGRGITVAVALLVGVLMVFVLPASAAAPGASASPYAAGSTWAYGGVKTVTYSGAVGSWQYVGQATFGYSVLLEENSSSSPFEVYVDRTMGALVTTEFCTPSCDHPTDAANLTYHTWETEQAWANFTTAGSVTEGSASVAAIALENSHAVVNGSLTESSTSDLAGVDRARTLNVTVGGDSNVSFDTPLGLLPLSLSAGTGQSWTSTSAFAASGGSSWALVYTVVGPAGGIVSVARSGNGTVNSTGEVGLVGMYAPGQSFSYNGTTYPAVAIQVTGPFAVREGFIFLPSGSDLFGTSAQPWSGNQSGAATASLEFVDALPFVAGHLGLVASAWQYAPTASFDTAALQPADPDGPVADAAPVNVSPSPTTVQGQPQSPNDAEQDHNCLVNGQGCPSAATQPGPGPSLHGLFGYLLVAVVLGAIIGAVVVVDRRRVPPPQYPNAALYPPGESGLTDRPIRAPAPSAPEPPPEDDPLSHLW